MSKQQLKGLISSVQKNIDQDLKSVPVLSQISKTTGIAPSHIFLAISLLILTLSLFEIVPDILTTLFGMLYPSYMSFKAIQKNNEEQKKIWLTYWIIFGLFTSCDEAFTTVLFFIPGYYSLRFLLYLWMFYPRPNNGSVLIYNFIKPHLTRAKKFIEEGK